MMHPAAIESRNHFGQLLGSRGLVGDAAEVGTHRGQFAAIFLSGWPGHRLWCVDHWAVPEGYEAQAATLPEAGATREDDLAAAREALAIHATRARLLRETSADAAVGFDDRTLDFVHLDADHSAEGFAADLSLWWPKLRPGGLLAGHDFVCAPGGHDWGRFIRPAVLAFARRQGVPVFVVAERGMLPWSFYLEKPGEESS